MIVVNLFANVERYDVTLQGRQSWGLGGHDPRFWAGGSWGHKGSCESWRVVKYYYILLCTGSMFGSGDF